MRVCVSLFAYVCVRVSVVNSDQMYSTDQLCSCCPFLFSVAGLQEHARLPADRLCRPCDSFSTVRRIDRQLERQRGLLMLFNCTIAKADEEKSVAEILGNKASFWRKDHFHMDMIRKRELAVPLVDDLRPADRTDNMPVVQLMHERVRRAAEDALPRIVCVFVCACLRVCAHAFRSCFGSSLFWSTNFCCTASTDRNGNSFDGIHEFG